MHEGPCNTTPLRLIHLAEVRVCYSCRGSTQAGLNGDTTGPHEDASDTASLHGIVAAEAEVAAEFVWHTLHKLLFGEVALGAVGGLGSNIAQPLLFGLTQPGAPAALSIPMSKDI
jgi:hypothetical protein